MGWSKNKKHDDRFIPNHIDKHIKYKQSKYPPIKRSQIGFEKSKIQIYAAYKTCAFNTKTQIG